MSIEEISQQKERITEAFRLIMELTHVITIQKSVLNGLIDSLEEEFVANVPSEERTTSFSADLVMLRNKLLGGKKKDFFDFSFEISNEESLTKMELRKLLELIQSRLAFNLDSLYERSIKLIGTEKQYNLGFLKENLKQQIEQYIKVIVKNIIHKLYNPSFQELGKHIDNLILGLKEAIK